MLKKITLLLLAGALTVGFIGFRSKFYGSQPPSNHSGAPDGVGLCSNCHGNLNNGGGSVVINGLPASFQPGITYPFSVTISHPATRGRWGFEINARNEAGSPVGTFSSTNPNAALNSGPAEISHLDAVYSTGTSYIYNNLSWTAPATTSAADNQVRFYVAGNAANGDGINTGDYIYTNTTQFTLPIVLKELHCKVTEEDKVRIDWITASEVNSKEFVIEKSDDNSTYVATGRIAAAGYSSSEKSYSFTDVRPFSLQQIIYYRLKLVDLDGTFRYSKTVKAELRAKAIYVKSLFPNPASDFINADIVSDKATQAEVTIIAASGKSVEKRVLLLHKGRKVYTLPLPALNRGAYLLQLQTKENRHTIPFTVL